MTKTEYTFRWLHKWAEIAVVDVDVIGEPWEHAHTRRVGGEMVIGGAPMTVTLRPTLRMSILFGPDGHTVVSCDARHWPPEQTDKVIGEHAVEACRRYAANRTSEATT